MNSLIAFVSKTKELHKDTYYTNIFYTRIVFVLMAALLL
jgi:hypothetical protein